MAVVLDLATALLETIVTAATSTVDVCLWLVAVGLPLVMQLILDVFMSIWYVSSSVLQTVAMAVLLGWERLSSAFHYGLPYMEDWWAWSVEATPVAIHYIIAGAYSLYSGMWTLISTVFAGVWNTGVFLVGVVLPQAATVVSYTIHFLWFLLTKCFSGVLWITYTVISACSLLLSRLTTLVHGAAHIPLDLFHLPWKATEHFASDSGQVLHAVGDWGSRVVVLVCSLVVGACILVFLVVTVSAVMYIGPCLVTLQQCWYWLKQKVIHNTQHQRPQAQPLHHQHQDMHRHTPPAQPLSPVLQRRPLTHPATPAGGSEAQRLQHELEQRRLCVVCLDEEKEMMLKPCNHLCVCGECVQCLDGTCPVCRGAFQGYERVYT